jgi:hypothetical protein
MGAALVPLLTTAVGFGAQRMESNRIEERQRNALNQQLAQASERQRQGGALVDAALEQQRTSSPDAHVKSGFDSFMDQLRRTQGTATAGLAQVGDLSDRYAAGSEAANASLFDKGAERADQLARIDAPALQRMDEGITFGRLASDIGRLQGQSDVDRFLTELRMRQAGQGGALGNVGDFLVGYGSSGGDFGVGGGASSSFTKSPFTNPGVKGGQNVRTGTGGKFYG